MILEFIQPQHNQILSVFFFFRQDCCLFVCFIQKGKGKKKGKGKGKGKEKKRQKNEGGPGSIPGRCY